MAVQSEVEIRAVHTKRELNAFIKLPWKIYDGNPQWVPPLIASEKETLNKDKNPFFQHSEGEYFLAYKHGEIVGRIAALVNHNHNSFHNEKTGFFGFFESTNDQSVADALYEAAAEWIRERGMNIMRGPMNPSTNDTIGFLVDAFEYSPVIMMTYSPKYYLDLAEQFGFKKSMDVYAYWMNSTQPVPDKLVHVVEHLRKKQNIIFRDINMKKFWDEVDIIKQIYNDAWSRNWGFVPMTDDEFHHLAVDLKSTIEPDLVFVAEYNDKPVGFCLTLPDLNQALKKINGRLLPFGLIKLMYYAKKVNQARVITMGVIKECQRRGIDALFYYETYKRGVAKGYRGAEFSWVLENNVMMNRAAQMMGGRVYKTYRIYDYKL